MKVSGRAIAIALWALAAFGAITASLSIADATDTLRLGAVSDSANSPAAPKGSLVISAPTPAGKIEAGDIIVVGGQDASDSIMGTVTSINDQKNAVRLRALAFNTPDRWTYDLPPTVYKHVASIPLLGFLYQLSITIGSPFLMGGIAALTFLGLTLGVRYSLFKPADVKTDEEDFGDGIELVREIFSEAGFEKPPVYVKGVKQLENNESEVVGANG